MATIPYRGAGAVLTYQAAAGGGDKFAVGSGRLHVRNGGGAPITVTVNSQQQCDQGHDHDLTYAIANGSDQLLPPFDPGRFDDGTGFVLVTYSAVTSVTVAVIA